MALIEAHLSYDPLYRRIVVARVVEHRVAHPTLVDVEMLQTLSYHLNHSLATENLQAVAGQ